MLRVSEVALVAAIAGVWGQQTSSTSLSARQPAYTITSVPSRDASFLQQQVQLQWGKPYVEARQRVSGNQIYFLDPIRESVNSRLPDASDSSQDNPSDAQAGDDSTPATAAASGFVQTTASTRTARLERLAKKRGGIHDKRATFAPHGNATSRPIVPAMVQKTVRKPAAKKTQGSFVQMANTVKAATDATTQHNMRAEMAARQRIAAVAKATGKVKAGGPVSPSTTQDAEEIKASIKARAAGIKVNASAKPAGDRAARGQRFAQDMGHDSETGVAMVQNAASVQARERSAQAKTVAKAKLSTATHRSTAAATRKAIRAKQAGEQKLAGKRGIRGVMPVPSSAGLLQQKGTHLQPIHKHQAGTAAFVQKHFGIRNRQAAKVKHTGITTAPSPRSRHATNSKAVFADIHVAGQ